MASLGIIIVVMIIFTLFLITCLVVLRILHIFLDLFRFPRNSDKSDHIQVRLVSPNETNRGQDGFDENWFNIYRFFKSKRNYSAPDVINEELRSKLEVNKGKINLATSTSAVYLNNMNPWFIEVHFINHCDFLLTNVCRCKINIYFMTRAANRIIKI